MEGVGNAETPHFVLLCNHPLHYECATGLNDLRCPTCRRDMTESLNVEKYKDVYDVIILNKRRREEEKIQEEQEAIREMIQRELAMPTLMINSVDPVHIETMMQLLNRYSEQVFGEELDTSNSFGGITALLRVDEFNPSNSESAVNSEIARMIALFMNSHGRSIDDPIEDGEEEYEDEYAEEYSDSEDDTEGNDISIYDNLNERYYNNC